MKNKTVDTQGIISKLEYFDYRYKYADETLKIYLPMLCYLKIKIKNNKVKFSSHIHFGFHFLSLEYNFLIYSLGFYILASYTWTSLNKGVFVLFALFILHFAISFVKIEAMKTIVHNWIENDNS